MIKNKLKLRIKDISYFIIEMLSVCRFQLQLYKNIQVTFVKSFNLLIN